MTKPMTKDREAEGPTAAEVLAFLNGSGKLLGYEIGERDDEGRLFWWRKYLPLLTRAPPASEPPQWQRAAGYYHSDSAPGQGQPTSEPSEDVERATAWLYKREGGVAFDALPDADKERWLAQGSALVAALKAQEQE